MAYGHLGCSGASVVGKLTGSLPKDVVLFGIGYGDVYALPQREYRVEDAGNMVLARAIKDSSFMTAAMSNGVAGLIASVGGLSDVCPRQLFDTKMVEDVWWRGPPGHRWK
jgi:hypothetical protein